MRKSSHILWIVGLLFVIGCSDKDAEEATIVEDVTTCTPGDFFEDTSGQCCECPDSGVSADAICYDIGLECFEPQSSTSTPTTNTPTPNTPTTNTPTPNTPTTNTPTPNTPTTNTPTTNTPTTNTPTPNTPTTNTPTTSSPPSTRNPIALTCADYVCTPPENIENCPYDCVKSPTALTVYLHFDEITLDCTDRFDAPNNEVSSVFCNLMIPDRGEDGMQTIQKPWLGGYCPGTLLSETSHEDCVEQIKNQVSALLEPYNITIVTERPSESPYTMIVVAQGQSPTNLPSITGPYVCGVTFENTIGMIWAESVYDELTVLNLGCATNATGGLVRYMARYVLTILGIPLNTNTTSVMSTDPSAAWCSATLDECGEQASDYYDDRCTEEDALNHAYCPDQYIKETLTGACSLLLTPCGGEHPQCCAGHGTVCSDLTDNTNSTPVCCRPSGAEFTFSSLECCSQAATGLVCH